MAGLLAHQGGWDEILLVVAPLAVIGGLLMLARKRAERQRPPDAPAEAETEVSTAPAASPPGSDAG